MSTKKYVCSFYGVVPDMKSYLRKSLSSQIVSVSSDKLTLENLDSETEILGVFVESPITKKIIDKLPKLKLIVTMSTGYDHVDLKAAKKRKIPVCNVPSYGENTVAEHAFGLILALTRKLFPAVKRVKEGVYDYHGLRGMDLEGKTVGVVGAGHIGMHLIKMLGGFGVNILVFDLHKNKELSEKYNFKYVPLPKLLRESDIVSLHVPLFPETEHMINKRNIKKMKKGAYIVNTARGGLIDPEAIVWGLQSGHLGGVGLDVLEDEGMIQDPEKLIANKCEECVMKTSLMNNIIIDHPNSIVTPHNAFNSIEALTRIFDTTIENVKKFASGQVQNEVIVKRK